LQTFIEFDVCDVNISVGWGKTEGRFVKGGFAAREVEPYQFTDLKESIVYVSLTKAPYLTEINEVGLPNLTMLKEMRMAYDFSDNLPGQLKTNLVFRPRPKDVFFWDTEVTLELEKRKIQVDRGDFKAAIYNAKIVVIDHISTGIAELLLAGIPFILLYDYKHRNFDKEVKPIFDELANCGLLHTSAESAIKHITKVYNVVEAWWKCREVQSAVENMRDYSLAPGNRVTDYLLELLGSNTRFDLIPIERQLIENQPAEGELINANSQYAFGVQHMERAQTADDHKKAAYWILQAASRGHSEAEFRLGWIYEKGYGYFRQNPERAVYWYTKSAEHGNKSACANLGIIYSNGIGVPKDFLSAYIWFRILAAKGDTEVIEIENILEDMLTPEQLNYGKKQSQVWLDRHHF
jgi:TPR repeat protein